MMHQNLELRLPSKPKISGGGGGVVVGGGGSIHPVPSPVSVLDFYIDSPW